MAQDVKGQAANALEGSIGRIRDLNDRIVEAARRSGEASLGAYERLLQMVADMQESSGARAATWLESAAKAQASLIREMAAASPDALRSVSERVSEATGAAARQARRVPGEETVEGGVRGAAARAEDLPIANYDKLSAGDVISRLNRIANPVELQKIDAYERKHKNRKTVLGKIAARQNA